MITEKRVVVVFVVWALAALAPACNAVSGPATDETSATQEGLIASGTFGLPRGGIGLPVTYPVWPVATAPASAPPPASDQSFLAPEIWGTDLVAVNGWYSAPVLVGTPVSPRTLADVNGDGKKDLVGFGSAGVWLALSTGSKFGAAHFVVNNFGSDQGWDPTRHVRTLADINNDGLDDIVAFGDDGVWTALSTGTGFAAPHFVLANFGYNQAWRVDQHVRLLADVNGDHLRDIVAFGDDGVWMALGDGAGDFGPAEFVIANFGVYQGWSRHVRATADINGDGLDDVVGFGDAGVWTALSAGYGFAAPRYVLAAFKFAEGWSQLFVADVHGKKEIVGVKGAPLLQGQPAAGIWTAGATGDGGFAPPVLESAGADVWTGTVLADLNGDGYPDLVGVSQDPFSDRPAVFRTLGGPTGFHGTSAVLVDFLTDNSFTPFAVGDVDGDGKQDLVAIDYSNFNDDPTHAVQAVARSSVLPLPPPPPAPAVRVAGATPSTVTFSWTPDPGDRAFEVEALPCGQCGHLAGPSYVYTGLAPHSQACVSVQAHSWFGVSSWSPQVCGSSSNAPPQGYSSAVITNCEGNMRPVEMWVNDFTAGTGWQDKGTLESEWNGVCGAETGVPWTFSLTTGHNYSIAAVDFEAGGCGNSSPADDATCVVSTWPLVPGDANGPSFASEIDGAI
jgi:hypothetical protein